MLHPARLLDSLIYPPPGTCPKRGRSKSRKLRLDRDGRDSRRGGLGLHLVRNLAAGLAFCPGAPQATLPPDADRRAELFALFYLDGVLGREDQAFEEHLGGVGLCRRRLRQEVLEDDDRLLALVGIAGRFRAEEIAEDVYGVLGAEGDWPAVRRVDEGRRGVVEGRERAVISLEAI